MSKEEEKSSKGQGGDTQEDHPDAPIHLGEGSLQAIAGIGRSIIRYIDGISPHALAEAAENEEEFIDLASRREYYRYLVAVSLVGQTREEYLEEYLPGDRTAQKEELLFLEMGAQLAAEDVLMEQIKPTRRDTFTANHILDVGMWARDEVHVRFYHSGLLSEIHQFIGQHNPHLISGTPLPPTHR